MKNKTRISFVFANNWQGRQGDELLKYLDTQARKRDIIFGSEVEARMWGDMVLAEQEPVYATKHDGQVMINQANVLQMRYGANFAIEYAGENQRPYHCQDSKTRFDDIQYGNIMMISKELDIIATGSEFVFGEFLYTDILKISATPRVLQYAVVEKNGKRAIFGQIHGLWIQGNTKGDCAERDLQSKNVKRILDELRAKYQCDRIVLGGDFNLDITTRALATLEAGLPALPFRNGVREAGFTGTRTLHYRHYHNAEHSNFADYLLYSQATKLHGLKLGAAKASDHHSLEGSVS